MFISKKKNYGYLVFFFYFKGFFSMKRLHHNKTSYALNEANFNYLIISTVRLFMKLLA